MTQHHRLDASCRLALAAYLHDLGKFAERARLPQADDIVDGKNNTRAQIEKQNYCPHFDGRYTHVHAAYTAIGIDLLEKHHKDHLPDLVGMDMAPFAPWKERNADDSLINAAARHHKPETFLQWVIATADRLASGFERETFESYNKEPDEDQGRKLNHYTTRQWTLLEHINLPAKQEDNNSSLPAGEVPGARADYRYSLKPLSAESIFPVPAKDCEHSGKNEDAQTEYRALWDEFTEGVGQLPQAHRHNLSLWLDHFDSLWLAFTHAIPSATAAINGKVIPNVALYDHSKTTAALAVALWRYHADQEGHDPQSAREELRAQWDREREGFPLANDAWTKPKFLLIQGDFFGIQDFIFATGGQTQKRAAKLLRGRSFYVSLLTELAALKILEALGLPPTSQVTNAAGKFLIVAPNTTEVLNKLDEVQAELDAWFLQHTFGQSGIGLASLPACCDDFRMGKKDEPSPFSGLMKRLFEQLETAKLRRFDLCAKPRESTVFQGFLDRFEHGECQIDGRSPATAPLGSNEEDKWVSQLAKDQIEVGGHLASQASQARVLITNQGLNHNTLGLSIFDYHVSFTANEEETGRFGNEAKTGNLRRAWDFSLPASAERKAKGEGANPPSPAGRGAGGEGALPLWNGYGRRQINAYVPRFRDVDLREAEAGKYDGLGQEDRENERLEAPKTLNHLALDDKKHEKDKPGQWIGEEALMTLKGDVDNLGLIFQQGLQQPTFAKMAALSRQMNAFFAVYLPWLCEHGEEEGKKDVKAYRNTYTVFAGGDDFFLIGPWHSTLKLAQRMKTDFARYVVNQDIHFSAGLSMTKPGLPIRQLADLAEEALEAAKTHKPNPKEPAPKNAATAFRKSVLWATFDELMGPRLDRLKELDDRNELTKGYLYALLGYVDQAEQLKDYEEAVKRGEQPKANIQNALWPSHFAYRTRRFVETQFKKTEDPKQREAERRKLQDELTLEIAEKGIKQHGAAYKITLFTYLYQQRR